MKIIKNYKFDIFSGDEFIVKNTDHELFSKAICKLIKDYNIKIPGDFIYAKFRCYENKYFGGSYPNKYGINGFKMFTDKEIIEMLDEINYYNENS